MTQIEKRILALRQRKVKMILFYLGPIDQNKRSVIARKLIILRPIISLQRELHRFSRCREFIEALFSRKNWIVIVSMLRVKKFWNKRCLYCKVKGGTTLRLEGKRPSKIMLKLSKGKKVWRTYSNKSDFTTLCTFSLKISRPTRQRKN